MHCVLAQGALERKLCSVRKRLALLVHIPIHIGSVSRLPIHPSAPQTADHSLQLAGNCSRPGQLQIPILLCPACPASGHHYWLFPRAVVPTGSYKSSGAGAQGTTCVTVSLQGSHTSGIEVIPLAEYLSNGILYAEAQFQ